MKYTAVALALALAAMAPSAKASAIWYNGDFNNVDGLAAVLHGGGFIDVDAWVYDDFHLDSPTTVTGVYGNFLYLGTAPIAAQYEIRSGVSLNNGGTLLASLTTNTFAWTNTGTVFNGINGALTLYRLDIDGLNLNLGPGDYWLGLRPVANIATYADSYLAQTYGANAIGTPQGNNGNSYVDGNIYANAFDPADFVNTVDYSLGVNGAQTPEPGTWWLVSAAGAMGLLRRKLTRTTTPRQSR